jgi:transcriptional regulator with XRE-family HTH domain
MEITTKKMTEKKPKRAGRKRISFTDEQLEEVKRMVGMGVSEQKIADSMGVSLATISRRKRDSDKFDKAIKEGRVKALDAVASALFLNATENMNPTSQIFYLKNRDPENWQDRVETNHTLSIGSALDNARLRTSNAPANIIEGEKVPDVRLSAFRQTDKKSDDPQKDE